jgi:hypothetical protein
MIVWPSRGRRDAPVSCRSAPFFDGATSSGHGNGALATPIARRDIPARTSRGPGTVDASIRDRAKTLQPPSRRDPERITAVHRLLQPPKLRPPGGAAQPPVLSGDYRDLKCAKTGLVAATIGPPGEAPSTKLKNQLSHSC